ncbi:hypothetical protein BpHYR1_037389 [Brachionus plicatilis]|uniref:Uncharacterized protein n=1 Tax=Brachionus plicatilis TaxID=10195 RepID=A0A3M7RM79_BRAPC|nr:hypothetical protein BpHYR1_037389 [Brachionus plicatilis]
MWDSKYEVRIITQSLSLYTSFKFKNKNGVKNDTGGNLSFSKNISIDYTKTLTVHIDQNINS